MPDEPFDNPLDFPMALGRIGDMSLWLAPDEEERPTSIVIRGPGEGMLQSMVPLAQATMEADMRRLARAREREQQEDKAAPK